MFSNSNKLWFWLYVTSFVFAIVLAFFLMGATSAGYYQTTAILNSDNLLFPSMFLNMQKFGYSFESWQLPGALSLCPDFLICWVISFFTSNPTLYYVAYAVVHASLFMLLISLIAKQLFPAISYAYLSITNLLVGLLPVLIIHTGLLEQSFYVFMMSYHTGVYINLLWCFYLLVKCLNKQHVTNSRWLLFWVWLGAFSDMVFFVAFVLPVCMSLFIIYPRTWKRYVNILLFGILGLVSFYAFTKIKFFSFDLNFSVLSFENMFRSWELFIFAIKEFVFTRVVFFLSLGCFSLVTIGLFMKLFLKVQLSTQSYFFLLFLFFVYCGVIFAPVVNGSYVSQYDIRYCVMAFYLIIFFVPLVAFAIGLPALIVGSLLVILVSANMYFTTRITREKSVLANLANFINYTPPGAVFIDDFCKRNGVRVGVASYWNSIFYESFSRENIVLKSVYNNGVPYPHNQHEDSYFWKSNGEQQVFDFMVVDENTDSAVMCAFLGKPLRIEKAYGIKIFQFKPFVISQAHYYPYVLDYDSSDLALQKRYVDLQSIKRSLNQPDTARGLQISKDECFHLLELPIDPGDLPPFMKFKYSCLVRTDMKNFRGIKLYFTHNNEFRERKIKHLGDSNGDWKRLEGFIYMEIPHDTRGDRFVFKMENFLEGKVWVDSLSYEIVK